MKKKNEITRNISKKYTEISPLETVKLDVKKTIAAAAHSRIGILKKVSVFGNFFFFLFLNII